MQSFIGAGAQCSGLVLLGAMFRALWNFVTSSIGGGSHATEQPETKRHHTRHRRQYNDPPASSSEEEDPGGKNQTHSERVGKATPDQNRHSKRSVRMFETKNRCMRSNVMSWLQNYLRYCLQILTF